MLNPQDGIENFARDADQSVARMFGSVMTNQEVSRDFRSKYADFRWPKDVYPRYVSGGGFLANWKAVLALQGTFDISHYFKPCAVS